MYKYAAAARIFKGYMLANGLIIFGDKFKKTIIIFFAGFISLRLHFFFRSVKYYIYIYLFIRRNHCARVLKCVNKIKI